jgi:hypothetical protein
LSGVEIAQPKRSIAPASNRRILMEIGDKNYSNGDEPTLSALSHNSPQQRVNVPRTEDEKFFQFLKRHFALLTATSLIPLLTSAIGVLEPPIKEPKLNVISGFTCFIVFVACYFLRGWIGKVATVWPLWTRFVLFAIVLMLVAFTLYRVVDYVTVNPVSDYERLHPDLSKMGDKIKDYLMIFPLLVLPLAIVLLYFYALHDEQYIQNLIDTRLYDQTEPIRKTLTYYADYLDHARSNSTLKKIGEEILKRRDQELAALSYGRVEVEGGHTLFLQTRLFENFQKRFDAVSDLDIDFWLYKKDGAIAKEYFRLNVEAARNKTSSTRIFVLRHNDLKNPADIADVLLRHSEANIAWAVAVEEELSSALRQSYVRRDFALFMSEDPTVKAVTFFRDYRTGIRKFTAVFSNPNADKKRAPQDPYHDSIDEQEEVHRNILPYCWMASSAFLPEMKQRYTALGTNEKITVKKLIEKPGEIAEEVKIDNPTGEEIFEDLERRLKRMTAGVREANPNAARFGYDTSADSHFLYEVKEPTNREQLFDKLKKLELLVSASQLKYQDQIEHPKSAYVPGASGVRSDPDSSENGGKSEKEVVGSGLQSGGFKG